MSGYGSEQIQFVLRYRDVFIHAMNTEVPLPFSNAWENQ